jgi:hypothetical protein
LKQEQCYTVDIRGKLYIFTSKNVKFNMGPSTHFFSLCVIKMWSFSFFDWTCMHRHE